MSDNPRPRRPKAKNTFTTRSGKSIKLNRSLGERIRAGRDAKARRKAAYLSSLPKNPWKRLLYRLHPKRLYKYWFSHDGAIMALKIAGVGLVVIFLLLVGLFAYFRKDLPKIKDISGTNLGGSITYYDRTGKTVLFEDYNAVKRVPVKSDQISKYMKEATVAIEDRSFYHEGAFNVKGITRAAVHDLFGSGGTQGGSTITQQLVKLNEGWTNDHTIGRKIKELILAVELEREYSKDDILTGYLNIAPYGGVDYGVESASRDYFGIDASQLSLAQAAMLASIPKAPTPYSPYSSPKYNPEAVTNYFDKSGLLSRQHYVLDQMAAQGYITQAQADAAKKVDVLSQIKQLQPHYAGIKAPYFVLAAREQLQQIFPAAVVKRGGWKVITSLDMNMQNLAEKSLQDGLPQLRRQHADNAAFVAEDNKTGQVVALIGGVDFTNQVYGKINYATDVNISPGSSIKPYDYAAFINNNNHVGAGSILYDSVGPLPGYPCTIHGSQENGGNCLNDFDFKSIGPTTLRYALGGSRNIPAVKAVLSIVPNDTSPNRTASVSKLVSTTDGLMDNTDGYRCFKPGTPVFNAPSSAEAQCYGSAAIGDGSYLHLNDHVNGIASLARLGQAIPQTFILQVTNSAGKTLYKFSQPKSKQVVRPDAAYIVNNMAADPNASYLTGHCTTGPDATCTGYKFHRYKGWDIAIKTGTTNNQFDGLMMSWDTQYTAGIWVGNHTRTVSYTGEPEYMTDPIMREFMQGTINAAGNVKPDNWKQPSDMKVLPAYVMHVVPYPWGQTVPTTSTDLFPSWYVGSGKAQAQTIDKVSGKLATSCTPQLAQQTSYNSSISTWNVDVFRGGHPSIDSKPTGSAQPQATDDVHQCGDAPPTIQASNVTCDDIKKTCDFTAVIQQGTHPLAGGSYTQPPAGSVILIINGNTVQTQPIDPSTSTYTFANIPTSPSDQVQEEVVDSVLYSDTATATIPSSYAPVTANPPQGNNPPGNNTGH